MLFVLVFLAIIIGVITALVFFSLPFGKKEQKTVLKLGLGDKEYKINPMSGCLMSFLQIPLF